MWTAGGLSELLNDYLFPHAIDDFTVLDGPEPVMIVDKPYVYPLRIVPTILTVVTDTYPQPFQVEVWSTPINAAAFHWCRVCRSSPCKCKR